MTQSARGRILVVDDHAQMVNLLADRLIDAGFVVDRAASGNEAIERARAAAPDVVLTDLRMQGVDGFDVLDAIHSLDPGVPVLIMTAFGAIPDAINAIKRGAYHYLTKPFQLEEVLVYVERALTERRVLDENRALRRVAIERAGFGSMVGRSSAMSALYDAIERVAQSQVTVLLRGDSGSGKELVARALHFHGARRDRPFVAVNCTALPEMLLESELFGHAKGAFTGATNARRGLFVEADGGTLFLDEIGDMAPGLQAKLLRTLEDGVVRPVGADAPRTVDVRIIAATHQDLEARVRIGAFRQDLFFRLNVVPIAIPPLRSRTEDIPLLAAHFLVKALESNPGSPVRRLTPGLIAALAQRPWPGNVRELENLIRRLVVLSPKEEVDVEDLPLVAPPPADEGGILDQAYQGLVPLRQLEADYISLVIGRCGGNKTRAAEILGIDVSTIHRRGRGIAQ